MRHLKLVPPQDETTLVKAARILVGLLVIFGTITLATKCEEEREAKRHARYERCLKTGLTPTVCSFESIFNPGEYE